MDDFITIKCSICGEEFKIDRDLYSSFGPNANRNAIANGYSGNIGPAHFDIEIGSQTDLCPQCSFNVATSAIWFWAQQEDLYVNLPTDLETGQTEEGIQAGVDNMLEFQETVGGIIDRVVGDSNTQRKQLVSIIALVTILSFIITMTSLLSQ